MPVQVTYNPEKDNNNNQEKPTEIQTQMRNVSPYLGDMSSRGFPSPSLKKEFVEEAFVETSSAQPPKEIHI